MIKFSKAKTPLAVFAFDRPLHLEATLGALATASRLDECEVFIVCDGAKGPDSESRVSQARAVARQWASVHGATVVEQPRNLGLARSIIGMSTQLCQEYGRVIVVEDDLLVGRMFLPYMLDALAKYAGDENVYQVAGYMFPVTPPPGPETFFLPMVTTWGWATWQRAWSEVDWTAAGALAQLNDKRVSRKFDLNGSYPYTSILRDRMDGKNQSWGILWWWHVFSRGGLALFPARTLVANTGFDGSGYHCPDGDWRGKDRLEECERPLTLPEDVAADSEVFRQVTDFIRTNNTSKQPPWLRRIWWRMADAIKRRSG